MGQIRGDANDQVGYSGTTILHVESDRYDGGKGDREDESIEMTTCQNSAT